MEQQSRTRVLMVVPSPALRGGGDVWLCDLVETLRHEDLDLLVVFERDGELVATVREAGHRCAVLLADAKQTGRMLGLAVLLAKIVRQERPDVVVHWSPRAHLYGRLAQLVSRTRPPTVWVQHVMPSRFWLHRVASHLRADAVWCVSEAVEARQRVLYPRTKPVVVHPGRRRPSARAERSALRAGLGLSEDAVIVACVGRVEPWKGQDVLVEALALLRNSPIEVHALLVGSDVSAIWPNFASAVRARVDHHELSEHVTFLGHIAGAASAVAGCDVLVCSSREEGFGLAIVEAMALGIPVVATRCGGPDSFLTHGIDGLLVDLDDPEALAAAIAKVVCDPLLASQLAASAAASYRDRFTAEHTAATVVRAITEVAVHRRATP